MTTYYVRKTGNNKNTGTSNSPWLTITHGVNQLDEGDILIVGDGIYQEPVLINTPNVTVRSENPYGATIKGTWDDPLIFPHATTATWSKRWEGYVRITGANVEFFGFNVTNSDRRGIVVSGDGWYVHDCKVLYTFDTGVQSYQADNGVFENIYCQYASGARRWKGKTINGFHLSNHPNVFALVQSANSTIRGCTVLDSGGEGIDVFRCNGGCIVENCISGNNNALQIYVNRTGSGCIYRNNIAFVSKSPYDFWVPAPYNADGPKGAAGIVLRDELASDAFPVSSNTQIYNNLVVNTNNYCLNIGSKAGLANAKIVNNTFIAGPQTGKGVLIVTNKHAGSDWSDAIVKNNIFYGKLATINANANLIDFDYNYWSTTPINYVSGSNDVVGVPKFVNLVTSPNGIPNPNNYKLLADSICVNSGVSI